MRNVTITRDYGETVAEIDTGIKIENRESAIELLDSIINADYSVGTIDGLEALLQWLQGAGREGPAIQYDLRIGHGGDALNLTDQILEQAKLDPETRAAIEVLRDAIDRVLF